MATKIELDSNKRNAKKANDGDYVFVVEAVDDKGATIKNVDNDTVAIEGNAADYIVKATGAGVIVTKNLDGLTGAELKAAKQFKLTITLQKENAKKGVDAGVVKLAFADGSVDLTRDGKNIVTNGGDIISKKAKDAAALEIVNADETFDNQVPADDNGGQPGQPGQSFTLTTGVDNVVGNAADNTIDGSRAVLQGQIVDTLGAADKVDGGAGTDTLFIQNVANATVTPNSIKNVEVIQVENQRNGTYGLNLANGDASVTTVSIGNSTANVVTVNNIQSKLTNLNLDNLTAGVVVASAAAAVAGTSDELAISLNSFVDTTTAAGTASINVQGYETVTVTSNGTVANTLGNGFLGDSSLVTLNIAGSQNVTLTLDDNAAGTNPASALATINASTATGRVNVTLDAQMAQAVAFTGGAGNDTFNTNSTYGTTDVLDGGDGIDTLVLTNGQATGTTAVQSNVKNFENLQVSALTGTLNVNHFGATGLILGANMGAAPVVNFAAGTNNVDFRTFNDAGALAINVAGTATTDVLNVTAGNATAANGAVGGTTFTAAGVTINGAETVNLSSIGGTNTFGGVFTITDTAANQSLVITGNQNAIFTGAVRADTINASGMTGTAALTLTGGTGTTATTITGTANADVLNGSTAGDIINGGAGADTIANVITGNNATAGDVLTGGAGFDTFILRGDAGSAAALPGLYSNVAQITDFTVGSTATTTDILQLSATVGNYSGADALFAGIAVAGAGATAIQTVAQNAAAAAVVTGTDLIKLTTGVATTGLTAQQAFNAAIGTGTVTSLTAGDDIFVSFYDTTNSKMVIGLVDASAGVNTVVETGDTITIVGSIDMTAADYAAFNANNLSIIAA